jgi:hypothetical protein
VNGIGQLSRGARRDHGSATRQFLKDTNESFFNGFIRLKGQGW